MKLLLAGIVLSQVVDVVSAATEYCDSNANQKCSDGTKCSPDILDCSQGPNKCLCGTQSSTSNLHMCDSTVPNQFCKDGTPCSMDILECEDPRRCMCGRFKTPGQPQPEPQPKPEWTMPPTMPSWGQPQPQPEWTMPPAMPPTRGGWGGNTENTPEFTWEPESQMPGKTSVNKKKNVYCNPHNAGERCKDGTPCSSQHLDCITKGPDRCICPVPTMEGDNNNWMLSKQQQQTMPKQQMMPSNRAGLMEDPVEYDWDWNQETYLMGTQTPMTGGGMKRGSGMSSKTKRVYCDSTAANPQSCKDGTPCSPKYLDCVMKGLNRCICPQPGQDVFMPRQEVTGSMQQKYQDMQSQWGKQQQQQEHTGYYEEKKMTPSQQQHTGYYEEKMTPQYDPQDTFDSTAQASGAFVDKMMAKQYDGERVSPGEFTTTGMGYADKTAYSKLHMGSQRKNVYCNPNNAGERCKDGTPCLSKYLDCATKGPNRCICPSPDMMPSPGDFFQQVSKQTASFNLPGGPMLTGKQMWSLSQWLQDNDIAEFEPAFLREQLTTRTAIAKLTAEQLEVLGMNTMGLRNRVLAAVERVGSASGESIPALVPPEQWKTVVERLAPFFPTLPKATIGSAVVAAKGDGTRAASLIRRTTGLEPQEYTELVEETEPYQPMGQLPNMPGMPRFQQPAPGSFFPTLPQTGSSPLSGGMGNIGNMGSKWAVMGSMGTNTGSNMGNR